MKWIALIAAFSNIVQSLLYVLPRAFFRIFKSQLGSKFSAVLSNKYFRLAGLRNSMATPIRLRTYSFIQKEPIQNMEIIFPSHQNLPLNVVFPRTFRNFPHQKERIMLSTADQLHECRQNIRLYNHFLNEIWKSWKSARRMYYALNWLKRVCAIVKTIACSNDGFK